MRAIERVRGAVNAARAGHATPEESVVATLRGYQLKAVGLVEEAKEVKRKRILLNGAVGTGKSRIAIAIAYCVGGWIVTPSLEIIRGMLETLGEGTDGLTGASLAKVAWKHKISTPLRLANALAAGNDEELCANPPRVLIFDEAHGCVLSNAVPEALNAMLPQALWVGLTATPYRGSASGTLELRAFWGAAVDIMPLQNAIEEGFILCPKFEYVPLVETEALRVVNGEFSSNDVAKAYESELPRLARIVAGCEGPTAVGVSATRTARDLVNELARVGVRALPILQDTPTKERGEAYRDSRDGRAVLIQIRCLSQGVDMPWLTNYVDAQPTTSPTLWLQTIGRVMRRDPKNSEKLPRVICTNRNISQHGYLFIATPAYRDVVEFEQKSPNTDARAFLRRVVRASEGELSRVRVMSATLSKHRGSVQFLNLTAPTAEGSPVWNEHLIARSLGRILHAERLTGSGVPWEDERAQWKETPMPRLLSGLKTQKKRGGAEPTEKQWSFYRACARSVGLERDVPLESFDSRVIGIVAAARKLGWRF